MDEFLDDFDSGKIQFRDKWQFELKSDLFPLSHHLNNIIQQEFYFFIPNSLQVNESTYSNSQFYRDQTNLIRFKTPSFTLSELIDPNNRESPLVRIRSLSMEPHNSNNQSLVLDEVKLLGNIFHSALRDQISIYMKKIAKPSEDRECELVAKELDQLLNEVKQFRALLAELKISCIAQWKNNEIVSTFNYVEEFISLNISDYFSAFLYRLRVFPHLYFKILDERLVKMILNEQNFRHEKFDETENRKPEQDEYVLYRKGLLNKFIIDPLLLKSSRAATHQRYRNIIGAIPAGVAMLIYLVVLFLWQGTAGGGNFLLVNSQALILLTVVVYILKDRIKEELRSISFQKAAKWFSDYQTEIISPQDDVVLGNLKESFYFIEEEKLPAEVLNIRNRQFNSILEEIKRPEKIFCYKKVVNIKKKPKTLEARFYGLNIIFRLDIHHFLAKSEDPYHTYLILNPETLKLKKIQLPKVYHINILLKNTKALPDGGQIVEWNKYRLIVDKNGIKRIEQV